MSMPILSLRFAAFVLVTLAAYYFLPFLLALILNKGRSAQVPQHSRDSRVLGMVQNLILLVASYYFYSRSYLYYPFLLIGLTLMNFGLGHWLYKTSAKRAVLWMGILLNLAVMLWFLIGGPMVKASLDFSRPGAVDLLPLLILPVGMSYYTLNSISYLIDIRLKLAKPTTNLIDFALYLAWFPKLINGPLERARKFLPMLAEKKVVDNAAIVRSLTLILVGLFRASILGGLLTLYRPAVPLADPLGHGNPVLLWALVTYMFYLYNQFAGYTDLVRGVSGLFGIPLTRNFHSPFASKDISDFWTRWHISLSQWLRDYIYMPVSRAFLRKNPSRTNIPNLIVPPLVTMLISGLWHGADLNHLVWGAAMGLLILFENVRMLFRPAAVSVPPWRKVASRAWLAVLMMATTVPFLLDLKQSQRFFAQLFVGWDGVMFDLRPLVVIALSLLVDWFQHRSDDEVIFAKWPAWAQTLFLAGIPLAVMVIDHLQSAPPVFVYP